VNEAQLTNQIQILPSKMNGDNVIFVERKGVGHPDTLADNLAEFLSQKYSEYTLKKYGAILHHNFDKLGILGGKSNVSFGNGELTSPLRVMINGRVSTSFGGEQIPYKEYLSNCVFDFFAKTFRGSCSKNND